MAITPGGRGPQMNSVTGFMLGLTTLAIILRTYCRVYLVKSFGWDDRFALLAWANFVCYGAFAITGVYHGTGQHAWDIKPPSVIPIGLKWWWFCEPFYVLSNMALKASIGIMLLRLTIKPIQRWTVYITLAVTELYCLFFFLLFVLQCRPSSYFWTQYTGGKGTCINPQVTVDATYAYSAISCVGDWIFAIMPCFMVWDLKMNVRTKISVAMILGMGAIASTATIVRIPYVHTLKDTDDFLYATIEVAIWSSAETGLGIAACSIATLRPVFRAFLGRAHLTGASSSNQKNTSGPWPSGSGYFRSGGQRSGDIALRSDVRKDQGITTIIESGPDDIERADRDLERGRARVMRQPGSAGSLEMESGWRGSGESKRTLASTSDEEPDWRTGIKKTTISRQVISS